MNAGRIAHSCAMRGNEVFVLGGEISQRNTFETFNGTAWTQPTDTNIGGTGLELVTNGGQLFLFGGWTGSKLVNTIYRLSNNNQFTKAGEMKMARSRYMLFTVPHGFLENCEGK